MRKKGFLKIGTKVYYPAIKRLIMIVDYAWDIKNNKWEYTMYIDGVKSWGIFQDNIQLIYTQ